MIPYLTKTQLDGVLNNVTQHSIPHNIECYNASLELPIATEPTLLGVDNFPSAELAQFSATLHNLTNLLSGEGGVVGELLHIESVGDFTGDSAQDLLVRLSAILANLHISLRSEAMKFGIPLEEVVEACIGGQLNTQPSRINSAIKTLLFGLATTEGGV
jgi:hypothetical protein